MHQLSLWLTAYLAQAAVEVFSSRVVFFTLLVVAFIAWLLQRQLEESAEFESTKAAEKNNGENGGLLKSFSVLFTNKVAVRLRFADQKVFVEKNGKRFDLKGHRVK